MLMAIDFTVIPKEILAKVSENFVFLTASSGDIDFNQRQFMENVSELLDQGSKVDKETQKFAETVKNAIVYTDIKLAELIPSTLLISGVNFNFSQRHKALYSDAEIGLIGLGGNVINKKVNAKVVYQFGEIDASGDKLTDEVILYLEIDEFNWLYFHFIDDVVYTVSSYIESYNFPLQEIIDGRKNNEGYRFEIAPQEEVYQFRQEFVQKYIR
jgi:hypothetical protein